MKPRERYAPELVTDLYELTMAASYLDEGMSGEATFSLFVRDYPEFRSYFVSAGLQHLLETLEGLRFEAGSLEYLDALGIFSTRFLEYLRGFRFSGTIRAIAEGRIFFSQEPLLEVSAPLIEAQVIETLVLNVMQLETLLASKAARVFHAARGKGLIDFGMRRAHGVDAALSAARATYIAGFMGTSDLLAGKIYGIPVFGTMAHSYVTSFEREIDSFLAFVKTFPGNAVFLIDTYDTIAGAKKAVEAAGIMAQTGKKLLGVRLDSGDLAELSRQVRQILDRAGLREVKIMASGGLDEFELEALAGQGAEVDIYAVGTRVDVSADAPCLDMVYKLVEYERRPVLKLSSGKKTWIGKKQVLRFYDFEGNMNHDRLCMTSGGAGEQTDGGEPLLEVVMEGGRRVRQSESLGEIRSRFAREFEKLPEKYRAIRAVEKYPVRICESLLELDRKTAFEKKRLEVDSTLSP